MKHYCMTPAERRLIARESAQEWGYRHGPWYLLAYVLATVFAALGGCALTLYSIYR
jgi:hypothetical protein